MKEYCTCAQYLIFQAHTRTTHARTIRTVSFWLMCQCTFSYSKNYEAQITCSIQRLRHLIPTTSTVNTVCLFRVVLNKRTNLTTQITNTTNPELSISVSSLQLHILLETDSLEKSQTLNITETSDFVWFSSTPSTIQLLKSSQILFLDIDHTNDWSNEYAHHSVSNYHLITQFHTLLHYNLSWRCAANDIIFLSNICQSAHFVTKTSVALDQTKSTWCIGALHWWKLFIIHVSTVKRVGSHDSTNHSHAVLDARLTNIESRTHHNRTRRTNTSYTAYHSTRHAHD